MLDFCLCNCLEVLRFALGFLIHLFKRSSLYGEDVTTAANSLFLVTVFPADDFGTGDKLFSKMANIYQEKSARGKMPITRHPAPSQSRPFTPDYINIVMTSFQAKDINVTIF